MMIRRKSTLDITELPEDGSLNKVLCYGDVHRPHQDPDANALMWRIVKERIYPTTIVNMGDELDFPEISYFRREKPSENLIKETIYGARDHFAWLGETFPDAELWFLEGNHDQRWRNYLIDRAPEITVLPDVHLEHILELEKQGVTLIERKPQGVSHNFGRIAVGHWNKVSKHSAYTAKALVEQLLHSCVQAHTHRLGTYFHTGIDTELIGVENGCLCRLDPHYDEHPNWQQGFSVINITPKGYFKVESIEIVRLPKERKMFACYGGEFFWQEMTI